MNFENEFFLLFNYIFTKYLLSFNSKGQYISKQNCRTVVRIEKQIRSFVFWENLWLYNFVSRTTDL